MHEDLDLGDFIDLLNCKTKRDLEKHCRSFVLKASHFSTALQVAMLGGFEPYGYTRCFRQWSPDHLALQERDFKAIASNGLGPFKPAMKKVFNKISQTFADRRLLCAHLLYTLDHEYWFLFYFDQRDTESPNRQWKHGPHIHLISHHWSGLRLDQVWWKIQEGKANFPKKIHLRYQRDL